MLWGSPEMVTAPASPAGTNSAAARPFSSLVAVVGEKLPSSEGVAVKVISSPARPVALPSKSTS